MASANPWESTCVSVMLKRFKYEGDLLMDAVRQYVSRIIEAGEAWTEGKGTEMKYSDISAIIDSAINFLREKSQEISGVENHPNIAQVESASQWELTFVSFKLKYFKDLGDRLIGDVRKYVSKITEEGKLWTKGKDTNRNYKRVNEKIENAINFLRKKSEEIAGNQLSQPSCEQPSQSLAATDSASATINGQPQAQTASTSTSHNRRPPPEASTSTSHNRRPPLEASTSTSHKKRPPPQASTSATPAKRTARQVSTATTSQRQVAEPVQPAEETQLQLVLARIAAIEDDLRTFRTETETLSQVIQEVAAMSPRLQQLACRYDMEQYELVNEYILLESRRCAETRSPMPVGKSFYDGADDDDS